MYTIRVDKKQPDQLALMLIMNVIARLLPSGMYHVYRGLLSGAGHSMLAVWNRSLNLLCERGFYTEEEVESDRQWIYEQINGAG